MKKQKIKKQNSDLKILMTIILTALITFSITMLWQYSNTKNKASNTSKGTSLISDAINAKIKLVKNKISKEYIGEVDETKLEEYSIKGYVAGLEDNYSQYFTKEEMDEYTNETMGSFVGIGVYITKNDEKNGIEIYSTIKNSPAEAAGLKAGDIIKKVDDIEYTASDYDHIADKIKGKEGTKVKITILRNEEILDFEIERKSVELIRVEGQLLDNNIGYIAINSFDGKVAEQFKTEYNNLKNQGMTSLIIDVRNNGGGLVTEAEKIGDMITEKGKTLLIEKNKKGEEKKTVAKTDKEIAMNIVLLTNEYSASASEILAAIIKEDVSNGKIVGKTTYGKGVMQTLYTLADGSGLKLTTDKYYSPNHNEINKIGITPDFEVEYSYTGKLDKENDEQLKKAIEVLKNW